MLILALIVFFLMQNMFFIYTQIKSGLKDNPEGNTWVATGAGVGGAMVVILVIIGVIVLIRYFNQLSVLLFL